MRYSGEVCRAENGGDAEPFYNVSLGYVQRLIRSLVEGDTITVNCDT